MTTSQPDYYEILRIPRDASPATIQRQYRALIKEEHPDRFAGVRARMLAEGDIEKLDAIDERIVLAEQRSREINRAYDILSDPKRRDQYDRSHKVSAPQGPPRIVLSTWHVDLGEIHESATRRFEVLVENLGGMPSQISVDWETSPKWAGAPTVTTDASRTFPLVVSARVTASGLRQQSYTDRLVITIDGQTYPIEVMFIVRTITTGPGGKVPIFGAKPGAGGVGPPSLVFSRLRVDFGAGVAGRRFYHKLFIHNTGGTPRSFTVDWEKTVPGARVVVTPDLSYTFPAAVGIGVDTKGMAQGRHTLMLLVTVDGAVTRIPVMFAVIDAKTAAYYAPAPRSGSRLDIAQVLFGVIIIMVVGA